MPATQTHPEDSLDPTAPGPKTILARLANVARMVRFFIKFQREKPKTTRPSGTIPVDPLTRAALEAAPDRTLWRLGHSTILFKLQGAFFLTDPVFAQRVSPVFFAGPKRFHQPPISIKNLPPLKAILLSHDHYDHLDKRAMQKLARKSDWIIAPQGVGGHLRRWGITPGKIRELNWHDQTQLTTPDGGEVKLTCTPTQHFSGRSLWNRNQTLFCSWVIEDKSTASSPGTAAEPLKIFFGADSGYFPGFEEIGRQYGPFAVTLLENGAYNERWAQIHMLPEDTIQAYKDLNSAQNPRAPQPWLIPIHNGTFDLAFHPWTEPMERIQALAAAHKIPVSTPRFGEPVHLEQIHAATPWWRHVDNPAGHPSPLKTTPETI